MLTVMKIGGGRGIDRAAAAADIGEYVARGEQVVVAHGCSAAADALAASLGEPVHYVTSTAGVRSRYTDARMLDIFLMAALRVNAELVRALQREGVNALGLSGLDGALLRGPRKEALRIVEDGRQRVIRDDFTGRVEQVNTGLLRLLLEQGYTPVVAPLALADTGEAVNVDGDRAAAMMAAALEADLLVILSNVPGLLADARNERTLIASLSIPELSRYEAQASGGMRRKLIGAREALQAGVRRVVLADGRAEHPVQAALAGRGTVIA
ncbi:MAG TPA: [LysW]-aminoadipate kinase [Ktedonobacterales bacterium]|jgi:acetylglutamate/LysW-gamma-L-alpha-aminoadipate kinase